MIESTIASTILALVVLMQRPIPAPAVIPDRRRQDGAIHWVIIVALALAASLVTAGIIMCAAQGGVLEFTVMLDPWTVKFGCVKL